jgi:hypothetical protein
MRILISTIVVCALSLSSLAQTIERQVIGAAGIAVQNGSAGLSFTVGELATLNASNSSSIFTQGFQQAEAEDLSNVVDLGVQAVQAVVFPNPTVQMLELKSDLHQQGITELDYEVLDMHGRAVIQGQVMADGGQIDVSSLAASTYTLVLRNSNGNFMQIVRFSKISI